MKLKTFKRTVETEETNIELPAYFYIQGDGFEEKWIKLEEKKKITITLNYNGYNLEIEHNLKRRNGEMIHDVTIVEPYYLNCICSKEEFEEQLQYVKDQI